MTFTEMVEYLAEERAKQLTQELEGEDLSGGWDEDERVIYVLGHCNKVHPDLKEQYPKGWSLLQRETIDEALEKLGLTLSVARVAAASGRVE